MNKEFLAVLIGIIVFLLIVVMSIFFITTLGFFADSETSNTFKTVEFDGITASVPSNSNFVTDTNFHDDVVHGIYIMTYNDDTNQKFINETIDSFIQGNNLTEMHIDNVSYNIRTFISENPDNPSIYAIVVNDNKDKAIIISTVDDPKLAIKIAKTVKF